MLPQNKPTSTGKPLAAPTCMLSAPGLKVAMCCQANTSKPLNMPTCVPQQEVQAGQDGCHALHRRQLRGHSQLGWRALRPAVQQVCHQLLVGRPAGSHKQRVCILTWLKDSGTASQQIQSHSVLPAALIVAAPHQGLVRLRDRSSWSLQASTQPHHEMGCPAGCHR